jgi:hypothetical protein
MPSPLTLDVLDVIDSVESVAELILLRPQTPTGEKLREAVVQMRTALLSQRDFLRGSVKLLQGEVEGLRRQNALLTEALQEVERLRCRRQRGRT